MNTVNIPLPLSNTPVAKQMRVAAVLSAIAHELCTHIFQPTYLLRDSAGLNRALGRLAQYDPDMESHLRSVLLAASGYALEEDGGVDVACIKAVYESVYGLLSKLVPEAKRNGFKADLRNFCNKAAKEWSFMQKLDDRIVWSLGFTLESKWQFNWKPLVFDTPPPAVTVSKQRVNGAAPAQSVPKSSPAVLADGIAVWPAFYNLSSGNTETLVDGFVLHPVMVKAAEEEQKAMLASAASAVSHNPAKQDRERTRALRRASVNGNGVNGQASHFLS